MSTTIESKKVTIASHLNRVYDFAYDLNNFEKLLPKGKIKNFTSDGESCSFEISGMATLGLRRIESERPTRIMLQSENSPFPFTLEILLKDEGDDKSMVYQISELDVNPFMKAMIKKPLQNLFDHIADQLVLHFEEQPNK